MPHPAHAAPFAAALTLGSLALAQGTVTLLGIAPSAISADGSVVVGANAASRAAYWSRQTGEVSLGISGESGTVATGVSGDGSVICGKASTGLTTSWLWVRGQGRTPLMFTGATAVAAATVSRDGSTIGGVVVVPSMNPYYHATVWNRAGEGRLVPEGSNYSTWIHALSPDGSKAIGQGSSGIGSWAMLWNSTYVWCQNLGMVDGALSSDSWAMTPDGGTIVGSIGPSTGRYSMMTWTADEGISTFAAPNNAVMGRLLCISDDGSVAAGYWGADTASHEGGVWTPDNGMVPAATYFAARGVTGMSSLAIGDLTGVSADGRVFVGKLRSSNTGSRGFIVELPRCGTADFNHDGDSGTDADIEAFFRCLSGNCCTACTTADFNADGDVGTDQDIEAFFRVLGGGAC